jgi:PAS domain S-box-containing protein
MFKPCISGIMNRITLFIGLRGSLAADQAARMLHVLLAVLSVWLAAGWVATIPFAAVSFPRIFNSLVVQVTYAIALVLLRLGHFQRASLAYLAGTWIWATLICFSFGGLHSPGAAIYVSLPASAAWLLGYKAAIRTSGGCLLGALVFTVLEMTHVMLPLQAKATPLGILFVILQAVLINAIPVGQIIGRLRETLKELSRHRQQLELLVEQQRRTEHSLRESEDRFRAVADDAPALVWTAGPDGLCDYFNKTWLGFTGRTLEQELGKGWAESLHPEDFEGCMRNYTASFQTRRPFTLEYRLRRHDGQYRWVVHTGMPRFSPQGQFAEYVGYGIDVTESKEAAERLRESAKLESLGVLAGGIAHDFNNLLVGILGNGSLAMDMLSPSSPVRPLMQDMVRSGEKAAELTRQMLSFAGRGGIVNKAVDLSELVSEMIPLVQVSIPKKVQLRLDLARGLPAILVDPIQVQQIIMNFVINGAEACNSEKDGVVTVTTALLEVDKDSGWSASGGERLSSGTCVCPEVRDNGCGMDEQTKAKIFDPFFTTKFIGRGLGLSAVLGIVHSHKGAIQLQSAPGNGSTFKVLFPAIGQTQRAHRADAGN